MTTTETAVADGCLSADKDFLILLHITGEETSMLVCVPAPWTSKTSRVGDDFFFDDSNPWVKLLTIPTPVSSGLACNQARRARGV